MPDRFLPAQLSKEAMTACNAFAAPQANTGDGLDGLVGLLDVVVDDVVDKGARNFP